MFPRPQPHNVLRKILGRPAPNTFYALHTTNPTDTYPATGTRLEVREENFNLLAVHWSTHTALGHVGELMATGTKAAAYFVAWERIESEDDPRLKTLREGRGDFGMGSNNPVEQSRAKRDPALLHLDLHLDRDSLAQLQIFISRNRETVRVLDPDGEHCSVDVEPAHAFPKTPLRCTDRPTGLLCLEALASFSDLSLWERGALIAEDHFEQHFLERERQYPYEDGYREPAETDFHKKAYEVWNECGSEFYGRITGLERAERKVDALQGMGNPTVVCLSTHTL